MTYVASYVAAVPSDKKEVFLKFAKVAAQVFKDHGASRVVECWGDNVPHGTATSYPLAVKASEDEIVVTGWQEWPDKTSYEAGMAVAMSDERMKQMGSMPFDGKRLIFAAFEAQIDI